MPHTGSERTAPRIAALYVIAATALPAVAVALGWSPLVTRARWTSAGLPFALCVLGGFSIGLLYLPGAAALALAGLFGLGSPPARRGAA